MPTVNIRQNNIFQPLAKRAKSRLINLVESNFLSGTSTPACQGGITLAVVEVRWRVSAGVTTSLTPVSAETPQLCFAGGELSNLSRVF